MFFICGYAFLFFISSMVAEMFSLTVRSAAPRMVLETVGLQSVVWGKWMNALFKLQISSLLIQWPSHNVFHPQNYFARNFYNMRMLALFVAFAINFILLFYKVRTSLF